MQADCVTELSEFAVDSVLAESRLKGPWVEKDIDVFREPLNQIPSLRQTRAAFEDRLVADRVGDDP